MSRYLFTKRVTPKYDQSGILQRVLLFPSSIERRNNKEGRRDDAAEAEEDRDPDGAHGGVMGKCQRAEAHKAREASQENTEICRVFISFGEVANHEYAQIDAETDNKDGSNDIKKVEFYPHEAHST